MKGGSPANCSFRTYLNLGPSKKALNAERAKLKAMTGANMCFKPVPKLIRDLNVHLKGWANYFQLGYPRKAFRAINQHVQIRLIQNLRRRSQRPHRPPEGKSLYAHLHKMGLVRL